MLQDEVETFAYKPGWSVGITTMHDTPHLWVSADLPDAYPPHDPITIGHIFAVPELVTQGDCRRFIRNCIARVEAHELGEWLRFGDDRPFYPFHGDEGDPYEQELPSP